MAQLVWLSQEQIRESKACIGVREALETFCKAYAEMKEPKALKAVESELKAVLSTYNATIRLKICDKSSWPREELARHAQGLPAAIPPPQTPCDYIDEDLGWWGFGKFAKSNQWIGHGLWWKPLPEDAKPGFLENAAGNATNDCDVLEDKFRFLKKASVLVADYNLLRMDFPELYSKSEKDIDNWLLENCAYVSDGQYSRISKGGDQHKLLGMDSKDLDDYIDNQKQTAAIRVRSGGRAAVFLTNKGKYGFNKGKLTAGMLDVKGIGTHLLADTKHPKVTGFLNYADALRELMMQRLIQRLIELEGREHAVKTVQFYAVIDTGLAYKGKNPATGWENEKIVLSVRQRHSRILDLYEGFNFSGVAPSHVLDKGSGRELRRILIKYGVSAEFFPQALLYNTPESDGVALAENASGGLIDDLEGTWNLQVDAMGKNFMDFSDFFVLPNSPLPQVWRMSEEALVNALTLERKPFVNVVLKAPALCLRAFGTSDAKAAEKVYRSKLESLSKDAKMREAACSIDEKTGLIKPYKPKYCMCWFMELDDSAMCKWGMDMAAKNTARGRVLLEFIDRALPTSPLESTPPVKGPAPGTEKLPVYLYQNGKKKDGSPSQVSYHEGWVPGKSQRPKHSMECLTLEPKVLGRGIYRFFISAVVPRPIALVSSISKNGIPNLAPYSYFGAMGHSPATVCFSCCWNRGGNEKDGYDKDTLKNIKENKQFVVHIMSKWYVDVANFSCGNFLHEENEFKIAGATPIPSKYVKPPRVKEAAVQMECELFKLVPVEDETGVVRHTMVIGKVLAFHVHKDVYDEKTGTVSLERLQPIARMGGNTYSQPTGCFDLPRPDRKLI
uniref:Flavin reductase like domain-containing protein n=2 Tax=Amorphochlora amoebiformis TaxID=1561963 RepID=A0A7S0CPY5_9EUKA